MEVKGEMTKLDKRMNKGLGQGRGLSSRDKSSTLEDLIYVAKRDSLHSEADLGETHISWEDIQRKSNTKPFVSHTNCGCLEKVRVLEKQLEGLILVVQPLQSKDRMKTVDIG